MLTAAQTSESFSNRVASIRSLFLKRPDLISDFWQFLSKNENTSVFSVGSGTVMKPAILLRAGISLCAGEFLQMGLELMQLGGFPPALGLCTWQGSCGVGG